MSQPVSPVLLEMIRCPVSKSDLTIASAELIAKLNEKIAERKLTNRIGKIVEAPITAGLVNQDQSLLLPIRDEILILIENQAIPLGD